MLRDGPVELSLSPEELGKVKMTLSATDGAMTLVVTAERHDTLDLLRRNIDQLAQDFRDLGYDSLEFSFGQESPRQQAREIPDLQDGQSESASAVHMTISHRHALGHSCCRCRP